MNATFAACALIMSGWVSQDANDSVAPSPQNIPRLAVRGPSKQPLQRYASNRATRPIGETNSPQARMPLSPTDPRMFSDTNLPLPPTMDSGGPMPTMKTLDTRQRYAGVGPGENGNSRTLNERPFQHHQNAPAVSPYMLIYNNTANGTVSTYNAYVRPALAQRASQEDEEPAPGMGTPSYPSVFLNHGQYYPVDSDRQ